MTREFLFIAPVAALLVACGGEASDDFFLGTVDDPVLIDTSCDDSAQPPSAPLAIQGLELVGDAVEVQTSFSGGCGEHLFAVSGGCEFTASDPPQTTVILHHDAQGDSCEALVTQDVLVSLSSLRDGASALGASSLEVFVRGPSDEGTPAASVIYPF